MSACLHALTKDQDDNDDNDDDAAEAAEEDDVLAVAFCARS